MNCFAHLATLLRPLPGKMDRSDQKREKHPAPERRSQREEQSAGRNGRGTQQGPVL